MFHLLRLVLDSIDKVPLVTGFVWALGSRYFAYPFTCRLFDFDSFDSLLFRINNFQLSLNALSSNTLLLLNAMRLTGQIHVPVTE
jgi:hypothetical protein